VENLSFALDHAVWGLNPFGFHLTSLLLHALNVALVFALTFAATIDARREGGREGEEPRGAGAVGFVAAALFAVHPLLTEAVGYVSGRAEVLCATFLLLALLSGRRSVLARRGAWIAVGLVCFALGLATKEVAAMFPFLLLAYDRLLLRTVPHPGRRLWRLHLPLVSLVVLAGVARAGMFLWVEQASRRGAVERMAAYLLVQLEVVWRYLALLAAPVSLSIFHDVGLSPRASLLGGVALLALIAVAFLVRRRAPLVSLGVAWFLLLLVPSSSIIPLQYAMAEHRTYLASAGVFMAVAWGFGRLLASAKGRPRWRAVVPVAALVVAVALLASLTVARNGVWTDKIALWRDAAAKFPRWQTLMSLGDALGERGRCDEAIPAYRAAIARAPRRLLPYEKLRVCLATQGRITEAREIQRTMADMDPGFTRLCREIRDLSGGRVRLDDCVAELQRAHAGSSATPAGS
jgi:hypothetical protein